MDGVHWEKISSAKSAKHQAAPSGSMPKTRPTVLLALPREICPNNSGDFCCVFFVKLIYFNCYRLVMLFVLDQTFHSEF
jgi:hypothetical protein